MFLSEIQAKLKAPKSQNNDFGKYKYRSCEDILEAVKPLLNGAVLLLSDSIELIGDRYYVKATATISKGADSHSVTAYARETLDKKGMDASQITGSASSYARKYALNGLFAIDDTKDSDATNDHKEEAKVSKPASAIDMLKSRIDKALKAGYRSAIEKWMEVNSVDFATMTDEQAIKLNKLLDIKSKTFTKDS